ncbi:MAG: response regulator [Pseudodesulfovibrio sp.]
MTNKRFLIVDDDERFVLLVAKKLEKYAHCVTSPGGKDALLLFEHHLREKSPFNAVFMDIEMPEMDGHQVIEKMRSIEKENGIYPLNSFKLIMLTAHKDVKNVSKSFFKGSADAYVHKEELATKLVPELEKIHLI